MNKLNSKPKIYHGKVNGKFFVISIFDNPDIVFPMKCGIKKFFKEWDKHLQNKKIRKEEDHAYFPLSSGNGCVR